MTNQVTPNSLPENTIWEFEKLQETDWTGGVGLEQLLERVNHVADSFLPQHSEPGSSAGRVKRLFTARSFRHYQTLGCIDAPEKKGRWAVYSQRHFVQALLIRRLLWERVSADRIIGLMERRSIIEMRGMFLHGVEFVARTVERNPSPEQGPRGIEIYRTTEKWNRIHIASGVELHLSAELPRFQSTELQRLLERLEQALREVVY